MSTKLKHQQPSQNDGNVVAFTSAKCAAEDCKKKSDLMNFCNEHYGWFKWGLLTREGKRPSDFDKKYQAFTKQKKSA